MRRKPPETWLMGVLVAAAIVRLPFLASRSVWYDEASSWQTASFAWSEIWGSLQFNVHLPEYYYLLKLWMLAWGESVVALRLFSVLFGVLAIFGAYLFAVAVYPLTALATPPPDAATNEALPGGPDNRRTLDDRTAAAARGFGLWVAAATAASAYQVFAAVEARMYALSVAGAAFSGWLCLKCLEPGVGARRWAAYATVTTAFLYTHHFALLTVAAQTIVVVGAARRCRSIRRPALAAFGGMALAYLPAGMLLTHQFGRVQREYWIGPLQIDTIPRTLVDFILPLDHAFDHRLETSMILAGELALLIVVSLAWRSRAGERALLWNMLLPLAVTAAVSLRTPLWEMRYFRFCHLYWVVGAVAAAWRVAGRGMIARHGVSGIIVALGAAATGGFWYLRDIPHRPGMAGAMHELAARRGGDEPVLVAGILNYFPAKLYAANDRRVGRDAIRLLPPETIGQWDRHLLRAADLAVLPDAVRHANRGFWLIESSRDRWPQAARDAALANQNLHLVQQWNYDFDWGSPQWPVRLSHYVRRR